MSRVEVSYRCSKPKLVDLKDSEEYRALLLRRDQCAQMIKEALRKDKTN